MVSGLPHGAPAGTTWELSEKSLTDEWVYPEIIIQFNKMSYNTVRCECECKRWPLTTVIICISRLRPANATQECVDCWHVCTGSLNLVSPQPALYTVNTWTTLWYFYLRMRLLKTCIHHLHHKTFIPSSSAAVYVSVVTSGSSRPVLIWGPG